MVDVWLIIVAVVLAILVFGLSTYFVYLYSDEADSNAAFFPRTLVVFGLWFALCNVLLLPYDVANVQNPTAIGAAGGLVDTELLWEISGYCIAVFTFVIGPFAIFWYENWEPEQESIGTQLKPAICYTLCTVIVVVAALVGGWLTAGIAQIKYQVYFNNVTLADPSVSEGEFNYGSLNYGSQLDIRVSLYVYLAGLMATIGWFFFFVFGGVGIAALPYDLLRDFAGRPKPMPADEYARKKIEIGEKSNKLIEQGKQLEEQENKGESGYAFRKKKTKFKNKVVELENEYEKLEISYAQQGGSVLQAYLHLVGGIIGIILSIAWFLHILLFNLLNVTPFLNNLFIALDNAFSLFGTAAYGMFAFYLLWASIKGCSRVGLNLLVFTIHPMKINGTLMNSFVFNVTLILLMSTSVIQFCTISFRLYAANTAVSMMYTTYVSNLKGISFITQYFQYPLLAFTALTVLFFVLCPCLNKTKMWKGDDDDDD